MADDSIRKGRPESAYDEGKNESGNDKMQNKELEKDNTKINNNYRNGKIM